MINLIVNTFREQARCHKAIKSFYYNRNYEIGNGNELHPMFWLEDPVTGRNQSNIFTGSVNFSILFIPANEKEVITLQNMGFSIGLNIIERIKQDKSQPISILPSWSYMTLRDYYDNNACGCRFSVDFNQLNMQNLCLIDEQFDNGKTLSESDTFNHFDIAHSDSHDVFSGKLPVFDLKTSK